MVGKLKRVFLFVAVAAVVSSNFSLLISDTANASAFDDAGYQQKVLMYSTAKGVYDCFTFGADLKSGINDLKNGALFDGGFTYRTHINLSKYTSIENDAGLSKDFGCQDNENRLAKLFFQTFGIDDTIDFLCQIGYRASGDTDLCATGGAGSGNLVTDSKEQTANKLSSYINENFGLNVGGGVVDSGFYAQYTLDTLLSPDACGLSRVTNVGNTSEDYVYQTNASGQSVTYVGAEAKNHSVKLVKEDDYGVSSTVDSRTCEQLFQTYTSNLEYSVATTNRDAEEWCSAQYIDSSLKNACEAGYLGIDCSTTYVASSGTTTPYYDPNTGTTTTGWTEEQAATRRAACEAGSTQAPETYDQQSLDISSDVVTCAIESIGWIICPVITTLGKVADSAFGQVETMMTVDTNTLFEPNGTAYGAWSNMRSIANVLFIAAFLVIIYSQITGAGLSNYGIKKMIPRLAIAAILINLSWYISVAAIEISNVIGSSMMSTIAGTQSNEIPAPALQSDWQTGNIGTGFVGWAAAAAVVGAAAFFFTGTVLAALLYVVFAVLTVVLLLGLREALLLLVVVLSPLAFAANLLPNTENLFKKWWDLFKVLLLAFPIVGLMYGLGKLAAGVLFKTGEWQTQIFGMVAMFAWIFVLKKVLESATSIGGLSGLVGKVTGGAHGQAGKYAAGSALAKAGQYRQAQATKNRGLIQSGAYKGKNPLGRAASAINKRINNSRLSGGFGTQMAAAGVQAAQQQTAAAVATQQAAMQGLGADKLLSVAKDKKSSKETRAAAFKQLAATGGTQHVQDALDYMMKEGAKTGKDRDADISDIQQLAAADIAARKPAGLGKRAATDLANGTLKGPGYNHALRQRIRDGAIGAEDFAKMDPDDHARLALMQAGGAFDAEDTKKLQALHNDVMTSSNYGYSPQTQHLAEQTVNGPAGGPGSGTAGVTKFDGSNLEQSITQLDIPKP